MDGHTTRCLLLQKNYSDLEGANVVRLLPLIWKDRYAAKPYDDNENPTPRNALTACLWAEI